MRYSCLIFRCSLSGSLRRKLPGGLQRKLKRDIAKEPQVLAVRATRCGKMYIRMFKGAAVGVTPARKTALKTSGTSFTSSLVNQGQNSTDNSLATFTTPRISVHLLSEKGERRRAIREGNIAKESQEQAARVLRYSQNARIVEWQSTWQSA